MGDIRKVYKILVRTPERKRPLEIPRRRWKIILEWILKRHTVLEGVEWMHLAQDGYQWRAVVNTGMNRLCL
jgi:hypothetical protein